MNALFYAHSGLRYLVLAVGLVAIAYYAYGLATRRGIDRGAGITGAAFAGLLDLQILLGFLLMAGGIYYGALIGHLTMMLLAAVAAHGAGLAARRITDPGRYYTVRLAGVVASLVLVVLGIYAIGRGVLATGVPSY